MGWDHPVIPPIVLRYHMMETVTFLLVTLVVASGLATAPTTREGLLFLIFYATYVLVQWSKFGVLREAAVQTEQEVAFRVIRDFVIVMAISLGLGNWLQLG